MKELKMTKEEMDLFNQDQELYRLNVEHIEKIEDMDLKLVPPRFCQTETTTDKHVIRVITYVMNRRSHEKAR